jgi:chromate transport protein ChrA
MQANTDTLPLRLLEVFARMWDLGFTAFGGPPVHFQILHRRFVDGIGVQGGSKWLDEQTVSLIYFRRRDENISYKGLL